MPNEIGEFVTEWSSVESMVMTRARNIVPDVRSFKQATTKLLQNEQIDEETFQLLDKARRFRNTVAHQPLDVKSPDIQKNIRLLRNIERSLR